METNLQKIETEIKQSRSKIEDQIQQSREDNINDLARLRFYYNDLKDAYQRAVKSSWKQLWKKLRIFTGFWSDEKFMQLAQINQPFNQDIYDYNTMQINEIFKYKMSKFLSKIGARPIFKIKLIEPEHVLEWNKEYNNKQKLLVSQYLQKSENLDQDLDQDSLQFSSISEKRQKIDILKGEKSNTKIFTNLIDIDSNLLPKFNNLSMLNKTTSVKIQTSSNLDTNSQKSIQNLDINNKNQSKKVGINKFTHSSAFSNKSQSNNNFENQNKYIYQCQFLRSLTLRNGNIKIEQNHLFFYCDTNQYKDESDTTQKGILQFQINEDRNLVQIWPLTHITSIVKRRYIQRKNCLELFLIDGCSLIFIFPQKDEQQFIFTIQNHFQQQMVPEYIEINENFKEQFINNDQVLQKWLNFQISNFEYIMYLNKIGGRTYKDLTQYPVMPWIIIDYQADQLNINNPQQFRNLQKTMGALGDQKRINHFWQKYELVDPFNPKPKFQFGSHYSSPAIVFQFLVRVHPYSRGAWELQSGKFDIADRLFFSINETFKNSTEEMTDVRELVPEFYYMPEIFLNIEKHDFGLMQNGERVHNVDLPAWCKGDPYKFIVQHRKALECDNVSKFLNDWIDLIFGSYQKDEKAEKKLNKFYYLTYEDQIDLDEIQDKNEKQSLECQIVNFGQCPAQISTQDHPKRNITRENTNQQFQKLITDKQSNLQSSLSQIIRKTKTFAQKKSMKSNNLISSSLKTLFKSKNQEEQNNIQEKQISNLQNKYKNSITQNISSEQNYLDAYFELKQSSIIYIQFYQNNKAITISKDGILQQINLVFNTNNVNQPYEIKLIKEIELDLYLIKQEDLNQIDQSCTFYLPPLKLFYQGEILIIGGYWDGRVLFYSTKSGKLIQYLYNHQDTVSAIDINENQQYLVTGSKNGEICVQSYTINQEQTDFQLSIQSLYTIYDQNSEITNLQIYEDLYSFASSSQDGIINLYNIYNQKLLRSYKHPQKTSINFFFFSNNPLYSVIFFSKKDKTLYSYSINGQFLAKKQLMTDQPISPRLAQDSYQHDVFVYGQSNGSIQILDLPYLEVRREIKQELEIVSMTVSLGLSLDSKIIIKGLENGQFIITSDPSVVEEGVVKVLKNLI